MKHVMTVRTKVSTKVRTKIRLQLRQVVCEVGTAPANA